MVQSYKQGNEHIHSVVQLYKQGNEHIHSVVQLYKQGNEHIHSVVQSFKQGNEHSLFKQNKHAFDITSIILTAILGRQVFMMILIFSVDCSCHRCLLGEYIEYSNDLRADNIIFISGTLHALTSARLRLRLYTVVIQCYELPD